ncbi:MAG TPA: RHS repeat-associated core domain-containing protein [Allosphingosinicella sp.]|nr:RHS repeat-associated core domain-containing protein [Allosphingosinicella sp.]
MKTTSIRTRALACALLATTAYCGLTAQPAAAQTAREHRSLDANGVDLTWGDYLMRFTEGSIGSGEAELALVRTGVFTPAASNGHEWDGVILVQNSASGLVNNDVYLGTTLVPFHNTDTSPDGSATLIGGGSSYVYRTADGTEIMFGDPTGNSEPGSNLCNGSEGQTNCSLLPMAIASPDGKTVTIGWDTSSYCPFNSSCTYYTRIAFTYAGGLNPNGIPTSGWFQRTGAAFYNDNVSTMTVQASTGYSYPATGVTQVTDTGGRVWRFSGTANGITAIRRPGASSDTTSIAYSSGSSVSSVTSEGVTTSYSRSVSGPVATMTVTNALSQVSTVVSDLTKGRPTSVTDPLNRTTAYQYDTSGRLTRVTAPEGNYVQYSYDARGNVTQTRAVAKSGSGLADIVTSASYDATCSNPVTCNRPNSVTDARGNVTDYSYDSTHGGVLTVTGPAPTPGAVRPQTRYAYTLANGEYRLTGTSQCQTTGACAGGADEVKTTLAYDANGNVTSTSTGSGNGALTATGAMTYDAVGNLLTVDGPLSGTADTSRIRYNAARQVIGAVSPDPDGVGALKHRAVRNSYTDGLLTKVETGNVDSPSDADWAAFSSVQEVQTDYDGNARPVKQKLVAGGTIYALAQASYDALGRPQCIAERMNPSEFTSLPSDACTLDTQGSYGPDRITKTIYDNANQVTQVKTAFGVSGEEANEVTTSYTSNGLVQTVTDAENNRTTYEYDGHDRLSQTLFPDTAKGAGTSSTGDYEQLGYDAGSNVTSFRNRANETIAFSYDALGRLTLKNLPGSEPDVSYGYDLLGRMTGTSQSGHALAFSYDALGRNLAQAGPLGTVSSQWDLAGRRTRLTYPDAFYVTYDHLVTGEVTAIRENGATSGLGVIATLAYDDLGRRTSLTRGNGVVTGYTYDSVSRLAQLGLDFPGTADDLTLGFAYSPAGQIVSTTRSNNLYAWTGHGSGTTSTTSNGLNQIAGWVSALGHDARGNVTSDGTYTYSYSSENLLTALANPSGTVQTSSTYAYDPLMRLANIDSSHAALDAQLAYDGDEIVFEGLSDSRTRRYVFGPGIDEPLLAYLITSSGTSRLWYKADERGSIVRLSSDAGVPGGVGKYDEYGVGTGVSRFHYTGQYWLADGNLHYYRARIYDARLGRFLQPDPIGYGAGMNLYAYVGGDPVNRTDPSGTRLCYLESHRRSGLPCGNENDGDVLEKSDSSGGTGESKSGGGAPVGELWKSLYPTPGVPKETDTSPGSGWMSDAEALKASDIVITGRRDPFLIFAGDPRAPGERGTTSSSSGSGDPYKNMKPHPTKPGYVIERHHQTGKKIIKKAPPGFPWDKFKFFPPLFIFPPDFYNRCSMIAFPDCPKRPMA